MAIVGNVWRGTVYWYDEDGNLVDPHVVTAHVLAPDETVTSYTYPCDQIVREAVGIYHIDVTPTSDGNWKVGAKALSSAHLPYAAVEIEFTVEPSWIP